MDLCRQCNAPKSNTHYGVKISNFEKKNPLEILMKIFKLSYTGGYRFIGGQYFTRTFFGSFGNKKWRFTANSFWKYCQNTENLLNWEVPLYRGYSKIMNLQCSFSIPKILKTFTSRRFILYLGTNEAVFIKYRNST